MVKENSLELTVERLIQGEARGALCASLRLETVFRGSEFYRPEL
jgi:hypothetical protein